MAKNVLDDIREYKYEYIRVVLLQESPCYNPGERHEKGNYYIYVMDVDDNSVDDNCITIHGLIVNDTDTYKNIIVVQDDVVTLKKSDIRIIKIDNETYRDIVEEKYKKLQERLARL